MSVVIYGWVSSRGTWELFCDCLGFCVELSFLLILLGFLIPFLVLVFEGRLLLGGWLSYRRGLGCGFGDGREEEPR